VRETALAMTAPIALFVYKRLDHTQRTIEALRANALASESELYVFSDAPRDAAAMDAVQSVRDCVKAIDGFKSVTVVEREANLGVDANIIDAVTTLCDRFGKVIVVEDDLVTSPWFLTYMNRGLDLYADQPRVMQVAGFQFPIESRHPRRAGLLRYTTCWGWGTWKRAWDQFDAEATGYQKLVDDDALRRAFDADGTHDYFGLLKRVVDGELDAWDIRWYLSVFMQNGLALFPRKSLVHNIGFDGSGEHCPVSDFAGAALLEEQVDSFPAVEADGPLWSSVRGYLLDQRGGGRLKKFARRLLGARSPIRFQTRISPL
jgi:hypothetical protein